MTLSLPLSYPKLITTLLFKSLIFKSEDNPCMSLGTDGFPYDETYQYTSGELPELEEKLKAGEAVKW